VTVRTRIAVLALALVAGACGRSAYTGRFRHASYRTDDEQMAITERAVAAYRKGVHPVTDPAMRARVAHVSDVILAAAKTGPAAERAQQLPWEIVVVEGPDQSVASFPNGVIFVEASLVRTMPNDDALAAMIGTAVARVLLRHGEEAASRRTANHRLTDMGQFANFGSSRVDLAEEQDEEADYVGCLLAVEAGYDPDRIVTAYDTLGLKERGDQLRKRLPELRERSAQK
jgi:predicted Zn-dependent protease